LFGDGLRGRVLEFFNFYAVLLVFGLPERSSSSTDTRPAFKHECHSKTAFRLKEHSPKASRSISRVSVADLPSFTQNLMQKDHFSRTQTLNIEIFLYTEQEFQGQQFSNRRAKLRAKVNLNKKQCPVGTVIEVSSL
jgi:hypothetical protein